MTQGILFEIIGAGMGLGMSLLVLAGLSLRLHQEPGPHLHLWAMVAFFAIDALDQFDVLYFVPIFGMEPIFYGYVLVLYPGYMISLWLFVRGLTEPNACLKRQDLIHLLPIALAGLCLAPFLSLPAAMRVDFGPDAAGEFLRLVAFGQNVFWLLWVIVVVVYGVLCARRLVSYQRDIREVFSDLEGRSLVWLDALVVVILLLAGIVALDELLALLDLPEIREGVSAMIFDLAMSGALGLYALHARPALPQWSAPVVAEANSSIERVVNSGSTGSKYARSGLTENDLLRLARRVEERMEAGKLWRQGNLDLQKLAESVALSPIHLSEVLNAGLETSFYDFVNRYRIREACKLLGTTDMSVLEVSEAVGYNAKSTFNASFKRVTSQTPSMWRRENRAAV
ncbi:helix-turn-helix domain-containing protein [Amaricoccus tamworthensis]|uniref:helix-turn-helix domain-containing protein n=1 Tax=Amaricoccus tamworthensis TaxID=57002 RepID=UPI003C7C4581